MLQLLANCAFANMMGASPTGSKKRKNAWHPWNLMILKEPACASSTSHARTVAANNNCLSAHNLYGLWQATIMLSGVQIGASPCTQNNPTQGMTSFISFHMIQAHLQKDAQKCPSAGQQSEVCFMINQQYRAADEES